MKLTIIETGLVPEPIRGDFEDYPAMFRQMMSGVGTYDFDTVSVVKGEALPDPDHVEAALITGSPAGVYDDEAWIGPLTDFIRAGAAAGLGLHRIGAAAAVVRHPVDVGARADVGLRAHHPAIGAEWASQSDIPTKLRNANTA